MSESVSEIDAIKAPWWELALTLAAARSNRVDVNDIVRLKQVQSFIDQYAVEASAARIQPLQMLDEDKGLLWRLVDGQQIMGFDKGAVITKGVEGLQAYSWNTKGEPYLMRPRTAAKRIAAMRDRQLRLAA